ncbi:MAG: TetR/AcrR family transcriptional regulator [Acidimicrobiia bacterium]
MARAKLRTPALRERVVQVAMSTLADHGVAGFTTRRVAAGASTSIPAVYELFGDKAGLVREVFFEGFRQLGGELVDLVDSDDVRADLERVVYVLRAFARDNPALAEVMFSRPFADFDPGPEDVAAGAMVREFIVGRVRRCVDAGLLSGDPTDIAHVVLAMAQGLATQETAGWLGRSDVSVDRRWTIAFRGLLDGLRPT